MTFLRWILIKCLLHVFAVSNSKVGSSAVSKSSKKESSLKHVMFHSEGLWGNPGYVGILESSVGVPHWAFTFTHE